MPKRIPVLKCLLSGAVAFGGAYFLGHSLDRAEEVRPGGSGEVSGPGAIGHSLSKSGGGKNEAGGVRGSGSSEGQSLGELLVEIKARGGSPEEERLAVMEAIAAMNVAQLQSWLEQELDGLDPFIWARFDFQFASNRFADLAPERAAVFWTKNSENPLIANTTLLPWAKRDPKAFGAWLVGLSPELQRSAGPALGQLGRQKPEEFARLAAQLANSPAGIAGAEGAILGMLPKDGAKDGAKADPAAALAYANELPEGPLRNRALATLTRWPGLKVEQYPEILAAVGELDDATARDLARKVYGFAEKLPPGVARETAFAEVVKKEAEGDPVAAAVRLEKMAGTPDYASAALGFVRGSVGKDPAAAAEWALSIRAESGLQRSVALETVAAAWFKANPEEARAWVEQAPLSGPEYFQLTGRQRSK